MAIGRLSVKVGKAGKAGPHAAYIAREGQYAGRLEKGEKLEATESGNMPTWAQHSPQIFWQAADEFERKGGTTYREFEIALPRELTPQQRLDLVRDFVAQEIGDRHAYQFAIHTPTALDGKEQPHAHIMFSERQVDGIQRDPDEYFRRYNAKNPEKGGARKSFAPLEAKADMTADKLGRKNERADLLKDLRGRWEQTCNQHLERAGEQARIDMRSYKDQGIDRQPEIKQMPSQWRAHAARIAEARTELAQVIPDHRAEVIDLDARRTDRDARIGHAMYARDQLFDRYRAGPEPEAEIALAKAYGLHWTPKTAADADKLLARVDERMKRLDEIEAKRAETPPKESKNERYTQHNVENSGRPNWARPRDGLRSLSECRLARTSSDGRDARVLQDHARPGRRAAEQVRRADVAPAPEKRQGTDLASLIAQGERVTPAPVPKVDTSKGTVEGMRAAGLAEQEAARLKHREKEIRPAADRHAYTVRDVARAREAALEAPTQEEINKAKGQATGHQKAAETHAGEAQAWRDAHRIRVKLGSTGPADELDDKAKHHQGEAVGWAKRAQELQKQRDDALARVEQAEAAARRAEADLSKAEVQADRDWQRGAVADSYTSLMRGERQYRRDHPEFDAELREKEQARQAEAAQKEAQRAQDAPQQDPPTQGRGRSR